MAHCEQVEDLPPFVSQVTPQLEDPSSIELFQQQIQDYLILFRQAVIDAIECQELYDSPNPITVTDAEVDFPNVPSNGSVSIDVPTAVPTPLGTHIISYAALTDATSIEDLLIQFFIVQADVVRITLFNPTGGAVNPDPITFQFITGAPA
jgi:hypothetical protein